MLVYIRKDALQHVMFESAPTHAPSAAPTLTAGEAAIATQRTVPDAGRDAVAGGSIAGGGGQEAVVGSGSDEPVVEASPAVALEDGQQAQTMDVEDACASDDDLKRGTHGVLLMSLP